MGLTTVPGYGELVLLPFQPEAPMTETLEWKTDLITAHDGSEYRQRIRKAPRQGFSLGMPVPTRFNARAVNTAYGGRARRNWGVPLWAEAQVVGAVSFGATSIALSTAHRDFREGSLALVWESPERWRAVAVETVSAGSIELTAEVGLTMFNALVMPLRVGRLRGNIRRGTNGSRTDLNAAFEVEDNIDLDPPAAPNQFEGCDIYFDENLFTGGGLTEEINARVDVVDYDAGPVTQFAPWDYNRRARPYRRIMEGPEDVWAFRQWLHRRAGRLRSFWLPSFENDMLLDMTGPVTDFLTFRADAYAELGADHKHIAVQTFDGTWQARTVTDVSGTGNFRTATLDAPLIGVDARHVSRVSFLGLHRLDTDRVELRYRGGGICVCEVRILEVQP